MQEAVSPARGRRGAGQRIVGLALVAGLFLLPRSVPGAGAMSIGTLGRSVSQIHTGGHRLDRRLEDEHVVLADCRDRSGIVSSQMAYFVNSPGPTPQDVAVVVTNEGQAALWVNSNTSALFTDTGVTFTATLGPRVEEGQFAGTGENGYGNFSCYQRYVAQLYTYADTVCSQVYDCDHSTPPENAGGSSGGMSKGTVIGIAVGVVGGVLFLVAAGLVIWFFRRWRPRQHTPGQGQHSGDRLSAGTTTLSPGTSSQADEDAASTGWPALTTQMLAIHEMDGRRFRVEMANDNGRFEMDPHGHGSAELDGEKEAAATTEAAAISPTSLPSSDSQVLSEPLPDVPSPNVAK